ncbi:unnamed protein product [Nezara viridula]|uniref:E3 ligase CCCH-type zinc finger domain-containing protein n=1 Tax=Nezara viridula TaxID=85310 RepID=A0A9P0HFM4_NEZVI|nr:unnamed protein product [Nezara viridula]
MVSLVPDYGASSLESSEESENENITVLSSQKPLGRLPPPTFSDKVKNSVFVNPYLEAENAQIAVLEKHVKMTELPNKNAVKVNKICWMFKKGKCSYGKKCRFSHSNTASENKSKEVEDEAESHLSGDECIQTEDSDEELKKKRKKRPGLTRGLIPSKKVLKLYKKHKKQDEEEKIRYLALIKSESDTMNST